MTRKEREAQSNRAVAAYWRNLFESNEERPVPQKPAEPLLSMFRPAPPEDILPPLPDDEDDDFDMDFWDEERAE